MRIIHTSDWHLGRVLHGVPLLAAQRVFLEWLAQLSSARQVDAVVVSGDIYDRALPSVEAVRVLEDGLDALTQHAVVILIPGNHDSSARLGFGARWFTERVRIQPTVPGSAVPIEVDDHNGQPGLLVYALPYLDPDLARLEAAHLSGVTPQEISRSHDDVVGHVVASARRDLEQRRTSTPRGARRLPAILMAHAFVAGGEPSESERDIRVGGVESVSPAVLTGFDYVALGHLHRPQQVQTKDGTPMRYSGSPLAYSFSERDHLKSVAVVDFDEDGQVSGVDLVPTPVPRRLSDVTGTLDEVLSENFIAQRHDWVRITVRGDTRPDNLLATLKNAFPYVLEHHFESTVATDPSRVGIASQMADPVHVTQVFVTQVTGTAPTPDEHRVLRTAYEGALAMAGDTVDLQGGR
jgi:exonuclease SbcD